MLPRLISSMIMGGALAPFTATLHARRRPLARQHRPEPNSSPPEFTLHVQTSQSGPRTPLRAFTGLLHPGPQSTCPAHPRPRSQAMRDSPDTRSPPSSFELTDPKPACLPLPQKLWYKFLPMYPPAPPAPGTTLVLPCVAL